MRRPIPSIHVFHSNIGGAGCTFFAALLADYFKQAGCDLRCFDSDPAWAGLSHYNSLNVERLWKYEGNGGAIDFDPVFESRADISILDCGPVGYGAFVQYIHDNRLENRANWMLHVPLMRYSLESSKYGIQQMNFRGSLPYVFWLNPFLGGPFTLDEALSSLSILGDAIAGSINLAGREYRLPPHALGSNMRELTLSERIERQTGMKKSRLRQTQKNLARLFDDCLGVGTITGRI